MNSSLKDILVKYAYAMYISLRFLLLWRKRKNLNIANAAATVDHILKTRCSVSRFGDGEFDMIIQMDTNGKRAIGDTFQTFNKQLAQRLLDILKEENYNNERHIVCIPYWFHSGISKYRLEVQRYCKTYFYHTYKYIISYLNPSREYFDTNMTRFYLSHKNKSYCRDYVKLLKQIWEKRDICFVEGEYSRLGIGNDLFSNANNISRILCPAKNAFESYDKIVSTILKVVPKDNLILIALGHTATVLAYDLSKLGYQAIDLGHIDVEYEWMLMGATEKVALPYKYVNEAPNGHIENICNDTSYQKQIIARISNK